MLEIRWTTKKTGLVLQYRQQEVKYRLEEKRDIPVHCWTEWTDVADVNGDVPVIMHKRWVPSYMKEPPPQRRATAGKP